MKIQKTNIILILFYGLFIRLFWIKNVAMNSADIASGALKIYKLLEFKEWVFAGQHVDITYNLLSPIYFYLYTIPFKLGGFSPYVFSTTGVLISQITLILITIFSIKKWGYKAALISTILYASSSYIIAESLRGLNPNFIPPLTVLFLYSLIETLKGKSNYLLVLFLTFSIMINYGAESFFVIPAMLVLYFLFKPKFDRKKIIYSLLIFFFTAVIPYGIVEKKFNGHNIRTIYTLIKEGTKAEVNPLTGYINFFNSLSVTINEILTLGSLTLSGIVLLVILAYLIRNSFIMFKNKKVVTEQILSFLLLTYILTFATLVKFSGVGTMKWWAEPVITPTLIILLGFVLSRYSKYVIIPLLSLFVVINFLKFQEHVKTIGPGRVVFYEEISNVITSKIGPEKIGLRYIKYNAIRDPRFPIIYPLWYYSKGTTKDNLFHLYNWGEIPDTKKYILLTYNSSSDFIDKYISENDFVTKSDISFRDDHGLYILEK